MRCANSQERIWDNRYCVYVFKLSDKYFIVDCFSGLSRGFLIEGTFCRRGACKPILARERLQSWLIIIFKLIFCV